MSSQLYTDALQKLIHPLYYTFRDKAYENEFLQWSFPERFKLFSMSVYVGGIITILFAIPDYLHLGYCDSFIKSVISRFSISSIALLMVIIIRKKQSPAFLDMAMLFCSLIIVFASSIIILNTAGHTAIAGLSEMLTVIVFYVFLPQRLVFSLVTGISASVSFLALRFFDSTIENDILFALLFSYTLANIFGFLYARNTHFSRRLEFFARNQEKNLRISLEKEVKEKEKLTLELKELSTLDSLTGLYNRRFLIAFAGNQVSQCERFGEIFSLILIDIDDFKSINDTFGHQEGDRVLINISRLFVENIRKSDAVARYGGEEFLILSPHHDIESAKILAEKIRLLVQKEQLSEKIKVTISLGVTTYKPNSTIDDLFSESDKALYLAKTTGKNKVVVFSNN